MIRHNKREVIGKLDRYITIQRVTLSDNAYGAKNETWADLQSVWAAVNYPTTHSSEVSDKGLTVATTRVEFTVLSTMDNAITVKDRITYGGDTYDIVSIAEISRSHFKIIADKRK